MAAVWEKTFYAVDRRRGLDYYRSGRVRNLTETEPGVWHADVRGSKIYHVCADKRERLIMDCTCPLWRTGRPCKHMAAVLYAIDAENAKKPGDPLSVLSGNTVPLFGEGQTLSFSPEEDSYLQSVPYFYLPDCLPGVNVPEEYSRIADEMISSGQAQIGSIWDSEGYFSERSLRAVVQFDPKSGRGPFSVAMEIRRGRIPLMDCRSYMRKYPCADPQPGIGRLCPHCIAALRLVNASSGTPGFPARFTDTAGRDLMSRFSSPASAARRQVHQAPVTASPVMDLSASVPSVLFKVGSRKKLQCKDLYALADAYHTRGTYALSDSEALDFSVQPVDEEARPCLDFLAKWTDNDRAISSFYPLSAGRSDRMLIPLYGERMDEFFDLCAGRSVPLRGGGKRTLFFGEKAARPRVTLTPVREKGLLCGIRGEGTRPAYLIGSRYAYCLDEEAGELDRMELRPVREWEQRLPGLTDSFSFTIGREALPDFYRRVVPFLREHADVTEEEAEAVSAWLPPESEITYYLDVDEERITCAVSAAYGEKTWRLLPGGGEGAPWRDSASERGALAAALSLFPETDGEKQLLYHPRDDEFICTLLADGAPEMEKWGRVMVSDRFGALRVHSRFRVQAGVRLQSDLLNLEVTCSDLSDRDLKEILQACEMKKRWHRLRSGEYVDLESEGIEELRQLMEAAHVSIREFVTGRMDIPAYRALYLDEVLREHGDIRADRDTAFRQLVRTFRTASESDFEVPAPLRDVLRPYQAAGFRWLMTLAEAGFGGILADDMGLGKTVQMICALKYRRDHVPEGERAPSLVVCPASLVYNWQAEFARFSPDLRVLPVTGTAAQRRALIAGAREQDVLITSYDLLKRDVDAYGEIAFDFQVLDEAQYIKTASSAAARSVKAVRSAHRFALTGTPIENSLSELWSIFDFLMPGFLYDYSAFRTRLEAPAVKDASSEAMAQLKKMTSPFLMRRLKKDVLTDLPDKLEEHRTVVLSQRQGELYSAQVHHLKEMLENTGEEDFDRSRFRLLAEITRLRQICCDPSLFAEGYEGESCKREALMDLLNEAAGGGHKTLVFSQFTSMLDLIAEDLKKNGMPYYMLTGATKKEERLRLASAFNRDDVPVFLISLKAGGTGLNLTGADIVVHYDPWWNAAAENQASDRAHRIGQRRTVTVYKLICRGTIEEKILLLQEKKRDLAEEILAGENGTFARMTREDLMALLGGDAK